MAITIQSRPQIIQPVSNPFYLETSSSNSTQPNYQTIFDVYTGTTGTTMINRFRIPTRLSSATAIFSPAKLLESYLTFDNNIQNTTGGTISTNSALKYYCIMSEEYGSLITGTTIYPNLANFSGYTFGGVLQYSPLANWNYLNYTPSITNVLQTKYLTYSPSTIYVRENDRETISFFNLSGGTSLVTLSGSPVFIEVTVYQASGSSIQYRINNGGATISVLGNPNALINHFGVGPWNLNNVSNANITGGTQPIIDFNRDTYYEIQFYTSPNPFPFPLFTGRTYNLDTQCYKYDTKRLMFLNQLNGWDYFNFVLVSKKTSTITRNTYRTPLAPNYTVGDAETNVLNIDGTESMVVNSNWVTEEEYSWLRNLLQSKQVYELQSDGTKLPIIITDTSWEDKKRVNNFIFNATINYQYAYNINGQRG